jgi:hypothetical protein
MLIIVLTAVTTSLSQGTYLKRIVSSSGEVLYQITQSDLDQWVKDVKKKDACFRSERMLLDRLEKADSIIIIGDKEKKLLEKELSIIGEQLSIQKDHTYNCEVENISLERDRDKYKKRVGNLWKGLGITVGIGVIEFLIILK